MLQKWPYSQHSPGRFDRNGCLKNYGDRIAIENLVESSWDWKMHNFRSKSQIKSWLPNPKSSPTCWWHTTDCQLWALPLEKILRKFGKNCRFVTFRKIWVLCDVPNNLPQKFVVGHHRLQNATEADHDEAEIFGIGFCEPELVFTWRICAIKIRWICYFETNFGASMFPKILNRREPTNKATTDIKNMQQINTCARTITNAWIIIHH